MGNCNKTNKVANLQTIVGNAPLCHCVLITRYWASSFLEITGSAISDKGISDNKFAWILLKIIYSLK